MIQGLKDMASMGLIYDISADMFAVVDNRCIVNPRNILMLLPKKDLSSTSYLSAKYRIIRREKYDMRQLYYLICELLRDPRSGPQLPEDVIKQCSLKSDSKSTINQMYNNQITIDQIKHIEFVGEQTKNSDDKLIVKVNSVGEGVIGRQQVSGNVQPILEHKQPPLGYLESKVEDYQLIHHATNHQVTCPSNLNTGNNYTTSNHNLNAHIQDPTKKHLGLHQNQQMQPTNHFQTVV
jgi:hypothetical protein